MAYIYIFWYSILACYSGILFGILFGIYSDILFGILSGIYSDIFSGILCSILSNNLAFYLTFFSGIEPGIYSDILSDMGTEIRSLQDEEEEEVTLIKSRDPHPGRWEISCYSCYHF